MDIKTNAQHMRADVGTMDSVVGLGLRRLAPPPRFGC